jgi:outer membrane protein assembly factor BamA
LNLPQVLARNARRARCAAGVVLASLAWAVSSPGQLARRDANKPILAELTFVGNANISREELAAAMVTEASEGKFQVGWPPYRRTKPLLDRAELERDLLRLRVLYWKRGWRASQITPTITTRDDRKAAVTLRVVEGPPTLIGSIELGALDSLLTSHGIRSFVDARPGDPLDLIRLDSIAVRIATHLDEKGYGDLSITPTALVDADNPRAVVKLQVNGLYQTTVEAVRVEGTEKYDPRVVANAMGLRAGDSFSRTKLVESQRALYEAGFFKRAYVRAEKGSRDSLRKVIALVEELQTHSFRVTGGVSTTDFLQFDARYLNANFRNNAGRLSVQATVGNLFGAQLNNRGPFNNVLPKTLDANAPKYLQPTFQVNADLRRRWLSDSRNSSGLSVFAYRRSSPGVFIDQGGGAAASFTRYVTRTIPVSFQYRLELTDVNAGDAYYCINFGACDTGSLSLLQRTRRLAPLVLSTTTDQRDDPTSPTRGFTWRAEFELADRWTGSQLRYGRFEVEGTRYLHPSNRLTVALHGRAGAVRAFSTREGSLGSIAVIHPRKRFYAGGSRSVRGYGENQLGPRFLVIPRGVFQPVQSVFDSLLADTIRKPRLPCAPTTPLPVCPTDSTGTGRPTSNFLDTDFIPKPLGAEAMIEGSIEARYRVNSFITLASFVDAGSVGARFGGTATVFTPGVGVRFRSPVGPIRVDLGYNPRQREFLNVVTELDARDAAATGRTQGLYQIQNKRGFDPATGFGLSGVLNALTLHLSIGEAF